jgi:hypothetical protein
MNNNVEKQRMATLIKSPELAKTLIPLWTDDTWSIGGNKYLWDKIKTHHSIHGNIPTMEILYHYCQGKSNNEQESLDMLKANELLGEYANQSVENEAYFVDTLLKDARNQYAKTNIQKHIHGDEVDLDGIKQCLDEMPQWGSPNLGIPKAKSIADFDLPDEQDPNELLKHRLLCRGGFMLINGFSGLGKSVFITQLAVSWQLGRECLGIIPARNIKSLIIQAEDDDGDLGEMWHSMFKRFNLDADQVETIRENVIVQTLDTKTGEAFTKTLDALCQQHKPDVVWINPIFSYIGGDASQQKEVSVFLRNHLLPVIRKNNVACVAVHHTAKPMRSKQGAIQTTEDSSYMGFGSVEFSNVARAVLNLVPYADDIFKMQFAKRHQRLKWKNANGDKVYHRYIGHDKEDGVLFWNDMGVETPSSSINNGIGNNRVLDELLQHIPIEPDLTSQSQLVVSSNRSERDIREKLKILLETGRIEVEEKDNPRGGKKLKYYYRKPTLTFDDVLAKLRSN